MKLRVKDNALDHAGKFEYFTIEPPVTCYEPYLNRNSLEISPFIYKLLVLTKTDERLMNPWIMTIRIHQPFIVVTSVSDPIVTKIESGIN